MGTLLSGIRERMRFKRWGKWVLCGGVLFVGLSVASVEVSSQSWFCNSCHIMEPYYSSWKVSSHKNVKCVECHIEPGTKNFIAAKLNGAGQVVDDVLNRTSHKPSASVGVMSCTRSGCHTTETLVSKKIDTGVFRFDHSKHLGEKHLGVEITCTTCHSHVKGDAHFQVNTDVCITCHLVDRSPAMAQRPAGTGGASIQLVVRHNGGAHKDEHGEKVPPANCTACHEAPKGTIEFGGMKFEHEQFLSFGATCESCHAGVTATPPAIEDGRCLECHTFGVEKVVDSREMHKVHTLGKHKIECSSCHGSVKHGLAMQTSSLENFECGRCHMDQHSVQRGNYFNAAAAHAGAKEVANPMFVAHVDCTGCHTRPRELESKPGSGAMVLAADAASCDRCHQEGFGARMIPLWQKSTRTLYDQIEADANAREKSGGDASVLAKVRGLLNTVKVDGSWGVHNPKRTQALLEEARDALRGTRPEEGAP